MKISCRAAYLVFGLLVIGGQSAALEVEELWRVSVVSDGTQGNDTREPGARCCAGAFDPRISSNGRYVTFASYSDNLVPGDTNSEPDTFIHDLLTGETRRVSVSSDGLEANVNPFFLNQTKEEN